MKTAGIIAEFNPLHNGHRFLLEQVRAAGATHVVCVLSGNFVQRGEPSVFRKQARTRAALLCGADLVIELPVAFAMGAAPDFSKGAVSLLHALRCVDMLAFGSECGDLDALCKAASALDDLDGKLGRFSQSAHGFAGRQAEALRAQGQIDSAAVLLTPNNMLAVEYLRAMRRMNSSMIPFTVLRNSEDCHAVSAHQIREMLRDQSFSECRDFLPGSAFSVFEQEICAGHGPVRPDDLSTALLSRLRTLTPEILQNTPGVSEGLEHRLFHAIRAGISFSDICSSAATKRYTNARIRRALFSAAIGVTKDDARQPHYLHVLGMNRRGAEILNAASPVLPTVTRSADLQKLSGMAVKQFELECAADDFYHLGFRSVLPCGTTYTEKIIKVQEPEHL